MKLFFSYIGIFLITSFSPSFANKPSLPISDDRVLKLSQYLPTYPPVLLNLESLSSMRGFDSYYQKLNNNLLKRNPINDAKITFERIKKNKEAYFILSSSSGISNFPSIIKSRNIFKPYKKYNKPMAVKFLQGTTLKRHSGYISYNSPSKIVDLYAKNATRYIYYWNRTMHYELIKMNSNKHIDMQLIPCK